MQAVMDLFSRERTTFGLTFSLKKTKVMLIPPKGQPYVEPNVFVQGTRLDELDSFLYFGSTPSDSEINIKIEKISQTFETLKIRELPDIKIWLSVYEAWILYNFIYSSVPTYRYHIKTFDRFHQACLRRILIIK